MLPITPVFEPVMKLLLPALVSTMHAAILHSAGSIIVSCLSPLQSVVLAIVLALQTLMLAILPTGVSVIVGGNSRGGDCDDSG